MRNRRGSRAFHLPRFGASMLAGVVGAVSLALIASSCGSNAADVERDAAAVTPAMNVMDLAALPSEAPKAEFRKGGGGLSGGEFTIWGMPGALGGKDQGIKLSQMQFSKSGGVRTKLTWVAGKGPYRFLVKDEATGGAVWNSGNAADNQACKITAKEASCTVPAGVLRVGGTYSVTVTAAGTDERRMFAVTDLPTVSGAATATIQGRAITTGAGVVGLGLQFSTADQGATADTANLDGFTAGLPPGWRWAGLPGGIARIKISDASGYARYTKILKLETGGAPVVLGCQSAANIGEACSPMTGSGGASGYSAIIRPGGEDIVVTSNGSEALKFDREGRIREYRAPGSLPTRFEYRAGSNALISKVGFGNLDWNLYYPGDRDSSGRNRCPTMGLPPGFVDNPVDYICEIDSPLSESARILYSQPPGAEKPRISRAIGLPNDCFVDLRGCPQSKLQVVDFGWDSSNRPFLQRDDLNTRAVLAGSAIPGANATDDPTLVMMRYDDTTGRMASSTLPANHYGAARQLSTYVYREYDMDEKFAPATRTVETTSSVSDGSIPAMKKIRAFDDGMRGIHSQGPDGGIQSVIWHPLKPDMQLGETDGETTSATTYDSRGNPVGAYRGPTASFSKEGCSPNGSGRGDTSCAPTDMKAITSTLSSFDQPTQLGLEGLARYYYEQSDFFGTPRVDLARYDSGFDLLPPGVSVNQFSLRLGGGIILPQRKLNVTITVPDGRSEGMLWLGGRFCGTVEQKAIKCVYDNSPKSLSSFAGATPVELELQRKSSDPLVEGKIDIRIEDLVEGAILPLAGRIVSRTRAMTEVKSIDIVPSTGEKATTVSRLAFNDIESARATAVQVSGTNEQQGAMPVDLKPSVTEYEPNGLGGRRVKSTTSGGQVTWHYTYWGFDQTPEQARVGNLDQLPEEIRKQPQYGLLRSTTDPTGRETTFVYDALGSSTCSQTTSAGPNWNCTYRDSEYREVGSVARSNDGQPDIITKRSYELGNAPGEAFMTTTLETESNGSVTTQVSKSTTSLGLLEYTDWLGTNTRYDLNALGSVDRMAVTAAGKPKDAPEGSRYEAKSMSVERDALGRASRYRVGDDVYATLSYRRTPGGSELESIEFPMDLKMTTTKSDVAKGTVGQVWTLEDKKVFEDKLFSSASGSIMKEEVAGQSLSFIYDGVQRLQQASIDGSDFTYGWDNDGLRVCAAANVANPSAKPCDELSGATKYEYEGTRPVKTTDPFAAIPANDAYNRAGGLRALGDAKFEYDAHQQLSRMTNAVGEQTDYVRDAAGRVNELRARARTPIEPSPTVVSPSGGPSVSPSGGPSVSPSGGPSVSPSEVTSAPSNPSGDPSRSAGVQSEPTAATSVSPGIATSTDTPIEMKNTTVRYGYSSPTGSPTVIYPEGGAPKLNAALPGGVTYAADGLWVIPSMSGRASVPMFADGTHGALIFSGPFGEAVGNDARPGDVSVAGGISQMGARSYSTDLASFIQPDPTATGSPGGQYGYTPSDPINYHDPTGTTWEKKKEKLPAWAGTLVMVAFQLIYYAGVQYAVEKITASAWFSKSGWLQKGTIFALYSGANALTTLAAEAIINMGHLSNVSSLTWASTGMLSFLFGYLGAYSYAVESSLVATKDEMKLFLKNTVDDVVAKITTAIETLTGKVEAGLNKAFTAVNDHLTNIGAQFQTLAGSTTKMFEAITGSLNAELPKIADRMAAIYADLKSMGNLASGAWAGQSFGGLIGDAVPLPFSGLIGRIAGGALGGKFGSGAVANLGMKITNKLSKGIPGSWKEGISGYINDEDYLFPSWVRRQGSVAVAGSKYIYNKLPKMVQNKLARWKEMSLQVFKRE